jgi:hypothetical protein
MPETLAAYTARELPPEEWDRLQGLPIAEALPDPASAAILVIERDGQIVATWAALTTVHLEGCYIAPAHQKSLTAVKTLVHGMNTLLQARGLVQVLTVTQTDAVGHLAEKLGGQPLGTLWLLPVPLGAA